MRGCGGGADAGGGGATSEEAAPWAGVLVSRFSASFFSFLRSNYIVLFYLQCEAIAPFAGSVLDEAAVRQAGCSFVVMLFTVGFSCYLNFQVFSVSLLLRGGTPHEQSPGGDAVEDAGTGDRCTPSGHPTRPSKPNPTPNTK